MAEAVLAIRSSDKKWYQKIENINVVPNVPCWYIVAIVESIKLPEPKHVESNNLGLMCAALYPTQSSDGVKKWGWVHLTADTKSEIGNDLIDLGAAHNEWWYLLLTDKEPIDDAR